MRERKVRGKKRKKTNQNEKITPFPPKKKNVNERKIRKKDQRN